jgi:thymidylate synthase
MAVAAAEALQLVGGFSDPRAMVQVSPHFEKFLDGGVLHAPYGPRVLPQLRRVVERLTADPSSRQAVVSIWDPVQDLLVDGSRDYPCTTHLQFMIRDGALDLHTSMRANDAWHGHPYDVFQFTFLQQTLAGVLRVQVGRYFHHATSFHLYAPQLEQAAAVQVGDVSTEAFTGVLSGTSDNPIQRLQTAVDRARELFYGQVEPYTLTEARLHQALRQRGVEGSW